jgi:hypothetical protein
MKIDIDLRSGNSFQTPGVPSDDKYGTFRASATRFLDLGAECLSVQHVYLHAEVTIGFP